MAYLGPPQVEQEEQQETQGGYVSSSQQSLVDDTANVVEPARVVSIDPEVTTTTTTIRATTAATATVATATPQETLITIEPNLDEIPRLLTMDIQQDNAPIVVEALKRLYERFDAATSSPQRASQHRTQATQMGAVTLMVLVMRKWKTMNPNNNNNNLNNPNVQEWACDCLAMLLLDNNKEASHVFPLVGAMEAVLTAMHQYPTVEGVQEAGLFALANALDSSSTDKGMQASSREFVEGYGMTDGTSDNNNSGGNGNGNNNGNGGGGIGLVVKAMKLFPANEDVQARGILLLSRVYNKKYRRQYLQAGCASVVSTSLENHLENADLEENATLFMEEMFPGKRKRK